MGKLAYIKCLVLAVSLCVGAQPSVYAQFRATRIVGDVTRLDEDTAEWKKISRGDVIAAGTNIRTSSRSVFEGTSSVGHRIKVEQNSEITIEESADESSIINVLLGKLRSWVKELRPLDKFQVKTPISVISVRGTDFSVEVDEHNKVYVEVFKGVVAAMENITGIEVSVPAGHSTTIFESIPPSLPERMEMERSEAVDLEIIRSAARSEMFDEISKDAVLSRAASEIKLAEFQNGKALMDASGKRVRLEEYVVRPADNQFKYVVLNTRENRFDFGKMLFTFNIALPNDLTEATKNMFYYEGFAQPSNWLTGVDSVMSNTVDKVNEIASGGMMYADNAANPRSWSLGFGRFEFWVNDRMWWGFSDNNLNGILDTGELSYYNIASGAKIDFNTDFLYDAERGRHYFLDGGEKVYFSEFSQPSGADAFHFRQKNNYSQNQWIAVSDYIIDDNGNIIRVADLTGKKTSELNDYAYRLNFERVYTSSAFTNQDAKNDDGEITIDLVFSSKLLIDSGILSLPNPRDYAATVY